MLERFLERVSVSGYKDNFLLKVGMSIQAMVEIETRTTMDMDAIIKGKMLSQSEVSVFIENKFLLPYAELRKFGKRRTTSATALLFIQNARQCLAN